MEVLVGKGIPGYLYGRRSPVAAYPCDGLKGTPVRFCGLSARFTDIQVKAGQVPRFMCLLLSPAESATAHTQFIAKIAYKLLNPAWREKALAANYPELLNDLFAE